MNKKVISIMMAAGIIMGCTLPAVAKPLNDTLKQQKVQVENNKDSLKKVQGQRENIEAKVEELDSQIENMMIQVKKIESKITKTQDYIKVTEGELKKAEIELDKEQGLFNERVRAMYINGADSYLGVVLESESFSDLITRIDTIKNIMSNDKDIINKLKGKRKDVTDRKLALDTEKQKLVALKSDNQNKLAKLNDSKSVQDRLVAELQSKEEMYASQIEDSQKLVATTLKKIGDIKKQEDIKKASLLAMATRTTTTRTPSRGSGYNSNVSNSSRSDGGGSSSSSDNSGSAGDVVAYASNFIGTPYVWGGTSPSGFDCSGFVQYVYAHKGISLPRVAADQASVGSAVSRDNLQAGDLVFFGQGYIHHVGMYVGNGCYIHAPRTGDSVKISPLNRSDYAGARRVR